MDTEKLISRVAIAVPLIHVFTCGIYIAGYASGFGGQIGGMFSASDFFTITIQHLATVYVTGLGLPLAYSYFRYRSDAAKAAVAADQSLDEEHRARKAAIDSGILRGLTIGLPLFTIVFFIMLLLQYWTGAIRQFYMFFVLMWMGTLPLWWRFAAKMKIYGAPVQIGWVATTFAISVLGMAMGAGDKDRRLPFNELKAGRMRCKDHVILSSIGDRFITVTKDNGRHIVNDECEVFAELEKVPTAPVEPLIDLVRAKIRALSPVEPRSAQVRKAQARPASTRGEQMKPLQP